MRIRPSLLVLALSTLTLVLAADPGAGLRAQQPPAAAAAARDPIIGTWTLNASQSKQAKPPKSVVRTFDETRDGLILVTLSQVNAAGAASFNHWFISADGKEYPEYSRARGAEPILWLSSTTLDKRTKDITGRRLQNGQMTVTTRMELRVSEDGKTLSVVYKDAGGKPTGEVAVFDRTL